MGLREHFEAIIREAEAGLRELDGTPPPTGDPRVLFGKEITLTERAPEYRSMAIPVTAGEMLVLNARTTTPAWLQGSKRDCRLVWFDVLEHGKAQDDQWQYHVEHGLSKTRFYLGSRGIGWPGVLIQEGGIGMVESSLWTEYRVPAGAKNIVVVIGEKDPPAGRPVEPVGYKIYVQVTRPSQADTTSGHPV